MNDNAVAKLDEEEPREEGSDEPQPHPADFVRFYRLFAPRVSRWVCRLGGTLVDVEDTVQEIFMSAHRKTETFNPQLGAPQAWLRGITVRTVLSRRRRALRREQLHRLFRFAGTDREANTPEENLHRSEVGATLALALERLPEKYRGVFVLFEMDEMSGPEIAGLLGLTVQNVWVRLHRARKLLAIDIVRHRREQR